MEVSLKGEKSSPDSSESSPSIQTLSKDTSRGQPKQIFFINLENVSEKKIQDPEQKKLIRSQATKSVRAFEAATGRRRKTKVRSKSTKPAVAQKSHGQPSSEYSDSHNSLFEMSRSGSPSEPGSLLYHDPFDTFHLTPTLEPKVANQLLKYCCEVFIPATFGQGPEIAVRRRRFLQVTPSRPAAFKGYLAMVEGHRLMVSNPERSLLPVTVEESNLGLSHTYNTLLDSVFRTLKAKSRRFDFRDGEVFEAHFSLAAASLNVGLFNDARSQLMCARQVAEMTGQPISIQMSNSDVKVSLALMLPPVFSSPSPTRPMPKSLRGRIGIARQSRLHRLGVTFKNLDLSDDLQSLLSQLVELCLLQEISTGYVMAPKEARFWWDRMYEIEHALLQYPFAKCHDATVKQYIDLPLSNLERLVQIASLALLSQVGIVASPQSALARAIARRQLWCLENWLTSHSTTVIDTMSQAHLEVTVWALLIAIESIAIQCPSRAPLYPWLQMVSRGLKFDDWPQVEEALCGLLYIPTVQRRRWEPIWQHSISISA